MDSNRSGAPARFIPFKRFHIAPLRDVTPEAIKDAAHLACTRYRDRDPLELPTALNFIAQKLGFKAGFGGFRQEYEAKLRWFMEEYGLEKRRDLISRNDPGFDIISLKPRQVGERLFRQDRPLPQRVFTGFNVDWYAVNNRWFHYNPWSEHLDYKLFCLPKDAVLCAISEAPTEEESRNILEAAVAACDPSIRAGGNLLGDQLLWFNGRAPDELKLVPRLYGQQALSAENYRRHVEQVCEVLSFFREWIEQLRRGWVEVLPYSGSLIFLKGAEGVYDFLFPGFRDELFQHNLFEPYLRNSDMPKSNDWYHFRRWLYFEYDGWLEDDQHRSEIFYYAGGGKPKDYPGQERILRDYLLGSKDYHAPKATAEQAEGFTGCDIGGTLVYVSNLVSIAQFKEFMVANRGYAHYSREANGVDDWCWVNVEEDESWPAAVTWYDANAYAAWVSKSGGLPVRLLTESEYDVIARPVVQPVDASEAPHFFSVEHNRLCQFFRRDGSVFPFNNLKPLGALDFAKAAADAEAECVGAVGDTPENKVDRYSFIQEAMVWRHSPSGLRFLVSNHFGEWLNDKAGAAVNTLYLTSVCYPRFKPSAAPFCPRSVGWYKGKKIGFRLCYFGKQALSQVVAR